MTEKYIPHQPNAGVRRSARVLTQTNYFTASMAGNRYAYAAKKMSEQEVLHQMLMFYLIVKQYITN